MKLLLPSKKKDFHADIVKSLWRWSKSAVSDTNHEKNRLPHYGKKEIVAAVVFLPGKTAHRKKKGLSFSRRYYKEGARFCAS